MGGAEKSCFLYYVRTFAGIDQVPPCVNVTGLQAQGNRKFLDIDNSGSVTSANGLFSTVITGTVIHSDGSEMDADGIVWDFPWYGNLVLIGVDMIHNVNIVNGRAFVCGLRFFDGGGSLVGNVLNVSGNWYDGNVGQAKWHSQTGRGGLLMGTPPSTLGTPPADAALVYASLNSGTGKMQLWAKFPTGADQLLATEP
jgi:hypothetical protein